ncbi:MAG: hypothetical protein IT381_19240 [Deltaproteobacteria bacterium]|nr:hypothetical protein [Deltaproteobacteria bacterium]
MASLIDKGHFTEVLLPQDEVLSIDVGRVGAFEGLVVRCKADSQYTKAEIEKAINALLAKLDFAVPVLIELAESAPVELPTTPFPDPVVVAMARGQLNPRAANEPPANVDFKRALVTGFRERRSALELSGELSRSQYFSVRWAAGHPLDLTTQVFRQDRSAARALTARELTDLRGLVRKYQKGASPEVAAGLDRLLAKIKEQTATTIKHPSTTRIPSKAESDGMAREQAIMAAFAEQFPPRQSAIYHPDWSTLSYSQEGDGPLEFSFTAQASAGGFAQMVSLPPFTFLGTIAADGSIVMTRRA